MKKRLYTWFIEPLDSHTNSIVSGEAKSLESYKYFNDEMGIERKVWECAYNAIALLRASRKDLNLHFDVWVREGHGKIRRAYIQRP
ncbi:MAG TPA: hypothetical protein VJC20_01950 [Candidatus Paceibacterota bacterium]